VLNVKEENHTVSIVFVSTDVCGLSCTAYTFVNHVRR